MPGRQVAPGSAAADPGERAAQFVIRSVGTAVISAFVVVGIWSYLAGEMWFEGRGQSVGQLQAPLAVTLPGIGTVMPTAGDREVTLDFEAPSSVVGAFSYEVEVNGGQWQALDSRRTVTGLDNGTSYTFRVRAVADSTTGQPSPPSEPVQPFGAPDQPLNVGAEVVGGRIRWTWDEPPGDGRQVSGYLVRLNGGPEQEVAATRFTSPATGGPLRQHRLEVVAVADAANGIQSRPAVRVVRRAGSATITLRQRIESEGPGGVRVEPEDEAVSLTLRLEVGRSIITTEWPDDAVLGRCQWSNREYVGLDWFLDASLDGNEIDLSVFDVLYHDSDVDDPIGEFCYDQIEFPNQVDEQRTSRTVPLESATIDLPDVVLGGADGAVGRSVDRTIVIAIDG